MDHINPEPLLGRFDKKSEQKVAHYIIGSNGDRESFGNIENDMFEFEIDSR